MAGAREEQLVPGSKRPTSAPANRAPSAFGWQDGADHAGAEHSLPGLHGEERLPWLNSVDDDPEAGLDTGRVWAFVLCAIALLLLIAGGLWWTAHRREASAALADGSLITAPLGPIKVAPQDPGGKTFDGTGDSSFTVSQGHVPGAPLAGSDQADGGAAAGIDPTAGKDGSPAATVAGSGGGSPGGIGVQVGAFSTQLAAEAAWAHLAKAYGDLAGSTHRIVTSQADIGTVYGLQAVAGSDAAANALCDRLKASGLNCQVKN